MSSKLIAIVVALAIVLAGATLFLIQSGAQRGTNDLPGTSGGRIAVGERLLDIDPSKITQIVLSHKGAADTLSRRDDGSWVLLTGLDQTWPLDDARIHAAIRLLLESRAVSTVDEASKIDDAGVLVSLTVAGGGTHQIKLASVTLGGQGLVEIVPPVGPGSAGVPRRLAVASDALHKSFVVGAPKLWRRTQLLPRVVQDAVGVRLVSPMGSFMLRKSQGVWNLIEPIGGPANPAAVDQLLATLDSLTITRFFDDTGGAPAEIRSELDKTDRRMIIETVRPSTGAAGGTPAQTVTTELRIGPTIDIKGEVVAAALGEKLIVGVDGTRLAKVKPDPTAYLSPLASMVRLEDVGILAIAVRREADGAPVARRAFKRVLEESGWVEVREDKTEVLQTRDRVAQITGVLQFLCALPASSIKIETPPGYEAVGSITLSTPGGAPLDEIEIGKAPGSAVWTRTGKIYRGYTIMPPMLTALMPEIIGAIPPPAAVPMVPTDVNKCVRPIEYADGVEPEDAKMPGPNDDKRVLEALAAAGSDLNRPAQILHYLYFKSKSSASTAGQELRSLGYAPVRVERVPVKSFWRRLLGPHEYSCIAEIRAVPTESHVFATSDAMHKLAARLGGVYDGWEASVELARLKYEESCRRLIQDGLLDDDKIPPMPSRRPEHDDEGGLGVGFFRTKVSGDLSNLTLPRTFFARSDIIKTSFTNSDLSESTACWNDFSDVDFTRAQLSDCDFRASTFDRAKFMFCDLRGVDFRHAMFRNCVFGGAIMDGVKLTRDQAKSFQLSPLQSSGIAWQTTSGEEPPGG